MSKNLGRTIGITVCLVLMVGGGAIVTGAASFAGRFSAPMWVILLLWGGSGLLGLTLGTVGTLGTIKWFDNLRGRHGNGPAH